MKSLTHTDVGESTFFILEEGSKGTWEPSWWPECRSDPVSEA